MSERAHDLPEAMLVQACSAAQRLGSWLELLQGDLVDALAARREAQQLAQLLPFVLEGEPQAEAFTEAADLGTRSAVAEVAVVCGISEYAVRQRMDLARTLPDDHPTLHTALLAGRIDAAKARYVAEQTGCISDAATRMRVEQDVLTSAFRLTRAQLAQLVDRVIARHDPDNHSQQSEDEARTRTLRFRSLGRGLSQMTLTADAETLATARAAVDVLAALADTRDPDARGREVLHGRVNRADVVLDTLRAAAEHPDTLLDQPHTDSTSTNSTSTDSTSTDSSGTSSDSTDTSSAAASVRGGVHPSVTLNVTVPLAMLLGRSSAPAELAGHGLIPAALVRQILLEHGAQATWRCVYVDDTPDSATTGEVTGPVLGQILGVGRAAHDPTYAPSPMTTALVQARDVTCRFPGCRRPAQACDLDHVSPHGAGGPTCETNLIALCRHHHRLKHRAGFAPVRDPATGTLTWTTPTGQHITLTDEYALPPPLRAAALGDAPAPF